LRSSITAQATCGAWRTLSKNWIAPIPWCATPPDSALANKILLPGVGHFGQMMRALDTLAVRDTLCERIRAGIPFLGICLGMQALFEGSDEAPGERGLGVFPGRVVRFPREARVRTWDGTIWMCAPVRVC